jgi:hypothetical protein
MPLFVNVIALRAGTTEPAGEPRLLPCPPDVEPGTVLSFLTQRLGEPVELVRAPTEHHQRVGIGWVFPDASSTGQQDATEVACIPFIESPGGRLRPLFEVHAGQQRQFTQLAGNHGLDTTVIQQPHRAYHPAAGQDSQDRSTPDAQPTGPAGGLDQALAAIAGQAGATLHTYPRPGHAWRRVVLRDESDDRGTRHLDAVLVHDGTLRVTGHDQGPRVSDFWGEAITSYEWVYIIATDRIPALLRLVGGHDGDDVLALLAAHHQLPGGQISDLMTHPRRGGNLQQLAQLT